MESETMKENPSRGKYWHKWKALMLGLVVFFALKKDRLYLFSWKNIKNPGTQSTSFSWKTEAGVGRCRSSKQKVVKLETHGQWMKLGPYLQCRRLQAQQTRQN